jgi:hypothetical protein
MIDENWQNPIHQQSQHDVIVIMVIYYLLSHLYLLSHAWIRTMQIMQADGIMIEESMKAKCGGLLVRGSVLDDWSFLSSNQLE